MTKQTPILEARGLGIAVGTGGGIFSAGRKLDIVMDVSLSLRPGKIVCVVGESGSGKTTLGMALVGLTPPTTGEIRFDGAPLQDFSKASFRPIRDKTALLFQDPASSFNPRQRIGDIIAEPRRISGEGATTSEAIASLAQLAGLPSSLLSRFPHALSGGQARRAAVARALSVVPRLIVADEPTAGLDVSVQGGVMNLFLDIREKHDTAFLIITHNLAVARHISDELVIMYLGRVVESGPTAEIFRNPQHPYTKALLDSEPVPDPRHRRNEPPVIGEVPSIFARPSGCEFHERCRFAQDLCRSEAPRETAGVNGQRVRCHFPIGQAVGEPALAIA
ncbi:peptide/nickel transport system ATP-binding protein [Ensifer adhaerens]|uniref:Peptide/nickel transport system ATP-binding protein n=1 Tax=Ensifer adhaerens TaxID=106592 RepID=A0ACC5SU57_ENSAD|nr:ABC transporter ATP-binding protein [Ensifer adhaerens]MBP1872391.1 peptide/nickel transport system ATP-binding protein [Ensifer adhaerens]